MVELVLHPVEDPPVKFEFVTRFCAWRPVRFSKLSTAARVRLLKMAMRCFEVIIKVGFKDIGGKIRPE